MPESPPPPTPLPQTLAGLLDRMVAHVVREEPSLESDLRPGRPREQISVTLAGLPLELPQEAVELFAWRDGCSSGALFVGYHSFLSLDAAIERYRRWASDERSGQLPGARLFPLFAFGKEVYAIECGKDPWHGRIHFVDTNGVVIYDSLVVYDSLTRMVAAAVDCYESGAYQIRAGERIEDPDLVAAVKLAHNPFRATQLAESRFP
jgi:hypothetical protein